VTRLLKIVLALLAAGALAAGGFAVFEHFDQAAVKKQAKRACGTLDTPTGSPALPPGLVLPDGQKLLRVDAQGKTSLVYASTAGNLDDVVHVRDAVLASLASQGYTRTGTDQEPGIEAEGQFGGKGEGTLKVKPLCTGRLSVRYTLRG
jgi:hypothetical protein